MTLVGIDIGGTSVKVAGMDAAGNVLWTGQSGFYERPDTQRLVAAIGEAADKGTGGKRAEWLRGAGALRVGMSVPGLLDFQKRMITLSVNVPGLVGIVLDELASDGLGTRVSDVWMGSDAVAGTYDVAHANGLAGRTFALAIGTGVGAAVIDDGAPLIVSGSSPGHFGQVDVSLEGEPVIGPDGGAGSLEGYIGVPALKARYGVEELGPVFERMTVKEVPMRALARAIRIAHAMYRPQHVALLGGIGIRLGHLTAALREEVSKNLTRVAREGWTMTAGKDDWHAARGAGKLAGRKG